MKLYFAARFSRLPELVRYREELVAAAPGYGADIAVNSRWLDGGHEWVGTPDDEIPVAELARFAQEDLDDLVASDLVVCFTEPARSGPARGGRHVEFGYALARQMPVIVVGHRENVFYCLEQVRFFPTWAEARTQLLLEASASPALVKRVLELEARIAELTADHPEPAPELKHLAIDPPRVLKVIPQPAAAAVNGDAASDTVADGNPWTPERVRKIQALLDLDREALARRLGVSVFTIINWEKGATAPQRRLWEALDGLEAETKGVTV